MTDQQQDCLRGYTSMIEAFLQGSLTVADFESQYLARFKQEGVELPTKVFEQLDALFGGVDAFCVDAAARTPNQIGETELRFMAQTVLRALRKLISKA